MGPFEQFDWSESDPEQPYDAQHIIAQDEILNPQKPEHTEDIKESGDANNDPDGGANDFRYTGPRYAGLTSYTDFIKSGGVVIQGPWENSSPSRPYEHECTSLEPNEDHGLSCPECGKSFDDVLNDWRQEEPPEEIPEPTEPIKKSLWQWVKDKAQQGFSQDDWELGPDEDYLT